MSWWVLEINYIFLNKNFVFIPLDLKCEDKFKKYPIFFYCCLIGRFNNTSVNIKTETCHP